MKITNGLQHDLDAEDWSIQMSQIGGRLKGVTSPDELSITNKDGDLFIISPKPNFEPLSPGSSRTYRYRTSAHIKKESELPKGAFLVLNGIPQAINFSTGKIDETALSSLRPTTQKIRYNENKRLTKLPYEDLLPIIPEPAEYSYIDEIKSIGSIVSLNVSNGLENELTFLRNAMNDFGIQIKDVDQDADITVALVQNVQLEDEAYNLRVDQSSISLSASTPKGIFYGIQSLIQYIHHQKIESPSGDVNLRGIVVKDQPRFGYRGMHLDVSRNFHRKTTVLKALDALAYFKVNKFHFHITDDEGWRLSIPGLPELTEVGSKRGYTVDEKDHLMPSYGSGFDPTTSYGSGHYTRADFIDILKYARDRHIEVIPEIDVPGHARAAIIAMKARYDRLIKEGDQAGAEEFMLHDPDDQSEYSSAQNWHDNVICVCQDGAYNFMKKVFEEVIGMYEEAGAPLTTIHVGGDEQPYGAWQKSPICDSFIASKGLSSTDNLPEYYFDQLKNLMNEYGLITSGWEEMVIETNELGHEATDINLSFLNDNVRAYVWNAIIGAGRDDMVYKLANAGYPVIMCNSSSFYFDMAYDRDPDEIGLSWSGFSNTEEIFRTEPTDIFAYGVLDDNGMN